MKLLDNKNKVIHTFRILFLSIALLGDYFSDIWLLELLVHFKLYIFVFTIIYSLYFLFRKMRKISLIVMLIAVLHGYQLFPFIAPYLQKSNQQFNLETSLKVMSYNLYGENRNVDEITEMIQQKSPDILLLLEVRSYHKTILKALKKEYPYQIKEIRYDNFGIALLSRSNFEKSEIYFMGGLPIVMAVTRYNGKLIYTVGAHLWPPINKEAAVFRNEGLEFIQSQIFTQISDNQRMIVMGDFNMTPWMKVFKDFQKTNNLKDSLLYSGLQHSWSPNYLIQLAIDHILFKNIKLNKRELGDSVGSDHRSVIGYFSL